MLSNLTRALMAIGLVSSLAAPAFPAEMLVPLSPIHCADIVAGVSESYAAVMVNRYRLNVDEAYEKIKRLKGQAQVSILGRSEGFDIYKIRFPARDQGVKPFRVVITAGVHGREAVGVAAAFDLIDDVVQNPDKYANFDITILPMLNPAGLKNYLRTMRNRQNLNRAFDAGKWNATSRLVRDSFFSAKFDLALDLHGSLMSNGFFVIKDGDDGGFAREALLDLDPNLLLQSDSRLYPGPAGDAYVLVSPGEGFSKNQGTLKEFWYRRGVPLSYTVEAPGRLDLSVQRSGLLNLLRSFLRRSTASRGLTAS